MQLRSGKITAQSAISKPVKHTYNTRSNTKSTIQPVIRSSHEIYENIKKENKRFSKYFEIIETTAGGNPRKLVTLKSNLYKHIKIYCNSNWADESVIVDLYKSTQEEKDQLKLKPFEFFYIPIKTYEDIFTVINPIINKINGICKEEFTDWNFVFKLENNPFNSYRVMRYFKKLTYINFLFAQVLFNIKNIKNIYWTGDVEMKNNIIRLINQIIYKTETFGKTIQRELMDVGTEQMGGDLELLAIAMFSGLVNVRDRIIRDFGL